MSLIVLTSASGSPGVTTTALGLALGWPRPGLLVEADPTGGSPVAAGYLRGAVAPPEAMIELALAHQAGIDLLEMLPRVCQVLPGTATTWLPGTRSHEQAGTLLGLWEPLGVALRSLEQTGQDVIVDAGRLGLHGAPDPLLYGADLALLVTRTDLVSLAGARSWAHTLREAFARSGASPSLGALLVGEGHPFTAREVTRVLGIPVAATIAWDPPAAAVLTSGAAAPKPGLLARLAGRDGWDESALLRSYRAARSAITARIRANQDQLQTAAVNGEPT